MNLNDISTYLDEYKDLYESNSITKEEYVNLLNGLEIEKIVTLNAEELQLKEELNTYVTAAIKAASILA